MSDKAKPLCLYGAGGHGRVVGAIAKRMWQAPISFCDTAHDLGSQVVGIPVAFSKIEDIKTDAVIVTIGDGKIRENIQTKIQNFGLKCGSIIANEAHFYADAIGAGTMVLSGAIVHPGVSLGQGVIVNSAAVVEHDCRIGDYCHVAPGAVVLGNCTIAEHVWIGANATVLPGVSICANVMIGAGAVVTKDITVAGTYIGMPAVMR